MIRVCAWCDIVLGETEDEMEGATHGICPACKAWILAQVGIRDADASPVACGAVEVVHEEYVPGAEFPEPRAPEWACYQPREREPDGMMDEALTV